MSYVFFFFFNDTATTEIYTLSLHDALPISDAPHRDAVPQSRQHGRRGVDPRQSARRRGLVAAGEQDHAVERRSEEHTSELQSLAYLVCRLLLEKKKKHTSQSITVCTKSIIT